MNPFKLTTLLGVGLIALSAVGCGAADAKEDKCTTPVVDGSPFDSTGTATVHGSGTLPKGLPDGYQLELELNSGGFSVGVLPPNLLDSADTCGQAFSYTIHQVDAGTYRLDYRVSPHTTSTDGAVMGTSTNEFTVADGESIEFIPTF